MNKPDDELMQRVLDGEAKPDEVATLEKLMAGSDSIRRTYGELEHVFQSLDEVRPVEPPAGAQAELVRTLRQDPPRQWAPGATPREGWVQGAVAALRKHFAPSLGYAFAAGAIAGVALLGAFQGRMGGRLDGSAPGSMLPPSRIAEARLVDSVPLEGPGFTATFRSLVHEQGVLAEIDCSSEGPATLEVRFDAAALTLSRFEQGDAAGVSLAPGRIGMTQTGENRYRLWFGTPRTPAPMLQIQIETGGAVLEGSLQTSATAP